MKTKLIDALTKVIIALENGSIYYNWQNQCSCNCGVVAQCLTGKSSTDLQRAINPSIRTVERINISSTWTNMVGMLCPITGESFPEIFKTFFSYGITKEDIINLEYLSDKRILKKAKTMWPKLFTPKYKRKINLIKYLKAWVEILKEEKEDAITVAVTNPSELKPVTIWFNSNLDEENEIEGAYNEITTYEPILSDYTESSLNELLRNAIEKENYEHAALYKKELEKRKVTIN